MTISSEVRKAGPYPGNGVADTFPFDFKIFKPEDLLVVLTIDGAEQDLEFGDDYGVSLNSDQENSPGGEVVLNTPLPSGQLLTMTSAAKNLQPTKITNQGAFYPEVVNQALDRVTILIQQVDEKVGRSVKVPISSTVTPDDLIAQLTSDAASARESARSSIAAMQDSEQILATMEQTIGQAVADATGAAENAKTDAEEARDAAAAHALNMGQAIAMAATFTAVPTEFKAWEIVVTQPHLRKMVWNTAQNKYVRAPWHQPCQLFFSYDNPSTIPGALPVRGDVAWNQADFPDVVGRLSLSGSGTFTLVEARGEGVRVLDNGRGVDVGRVLRSVQLDAMQEHEHFVSESSPGASSAIGGGNYIGYTSFGNRKTLGITSSGGSAAPSVASETRMRNIAFPLWMTI